MAKTKLFFSYKSEDYEWVDKVYSSLSENFSIWIDRKNIRQRKIFSEEIINGITDSDAAILFITNEYVKSAYIMDEELPFIITKIGYKKIAPIFIEDKKHVIECCLNERDKAKIEKLSQIQIDRNIINMTISDEGYRGGIVLKYIDSMCSWITSNMKDNQNLLSEDELSNALVEYVFDIGANNGLVDGCSQNIVSSIVRYFNPLGVDEAFICCRIFVEYVLFKHKNFLKKGAISYEDLLNIFIIDSKLDNEIKNVASKWKNKEDIYISADANALITSSTLNQWDRYFGFIHENGMSEITVLGIKVGDGFVVPQYLIAGLMSRFDEDWGSVLRSYSDSLNPRKPGLGFQSLQASQWITWLIWGPSVPLCTCKRWQGVTAFQLGYGDEDNSLPLWDGLPLKESPLVKIVQTGAAHGKAGTPEIWAKFCRTSGFFPIGGTTGSPQTALAQSEIFSGEGKNPFSLKLDRAEYPKINIHQYFTSYIWVIFLVCTADEDEESGIGLLWRRQLPEDENASDEEIYDMKLWKNLIPVFTHANIADPKTLKMYKEMLAQNALSTLKNIWNDRKENFHPRDLDKGIQFRAVCASDYTGCGCDILVPMEHTIIGAMDEFLKKDEDIGFRNAVKLPIGDGPKMSPWVLREYFSSCNLSRMISDYYRYIGAPVNNVSA